MRSKSKTVSGETLQKRVLESLESISKISSGQMSAIHYDEGITTSGREVASLAACFTGKTGIDAVIFGMVLESCYKSENISPGSADIIIRSLGKIGRTLFEKQKYSSREISDDVLKILSSLSRKAMFQDVEDHVKKMITSQTESSMIIEALRLSGPEGRIFVDPSPGERSVEVTQGYVFDLETPTISSDRKDPWVGNWSRFSIIDGMIDRVSEIHNLLESASREKEPLIIFARGFDPEVISTLGVNFARGTLNVVPVMVGFDVSSVNSIADLGVIVGGDVISPLKGDLITSIRLEDLPKIERATIYPNRVTVVNSESKNRVSSHIKNLRKRKDKTEVQDLKDLLDKRLRSLSSVCVNLRVNPSSEQEKRIIHEELDAGLRVAQAVTRYGIVKIDDVIDAFPKGDFFYDDFSKTLTETGHEFIPSATIASSSRYLLSTIEQIRNLSIAILVDENKEQS